MLTEEQVQKAKADGWRDRPADSAGAMAAAQAPPVPGYDATFESGCLDGQTLRVPSYAPERVAWPDRDVPMAGPPAWNGHAPIAGGHVYRRVAGEPLRYVFRRVATR